MNPKIKGKAFGVCANPQGKYAHLSVIASCSYEARAFGVKNGMPLFQALKLCPQLILVKSHSNFYEEVSRKMNNILSSYSDKIFQYGLDEWYMDFTDWREVFKAIFRQKNIEIFIAKRIKEQLAKEIHPDITCSIGIAPTKILAKVASNYKKPNVIFVINKKNFKKILHSLSLDDILGIGMRTVTHLARLNLLNLRDLEEAEEQILRQSFGIIGYNLKNIFQGKDSGFYNAFGCGKKSISRSKTLKRNIVKQDEILSCILWLLEDLCSELRLKNMVGNIVSLRLRYENFDTFCRQKKLHYYTADEYQIFGEVESLFKTVRLEMPVRLVGVVLAGLIKNCSLDLFKENIKN